MTIGSQRIPGHAQKRLESTPINPFSLPQDPGEFEIDQVVLSALPVLGTKLTRAFSYGKSTTGKTAKLVVELPSGNGEYYFLKIISGNNSEKKCQAEYESLLAMHTVCPGFVPKPLASGPYPDKDRDASFLLEEFRELSNQLADPVRLAKGLANLHRQSRSPTGKFGFHIRTWHGNIAQEIDEWDDSWASLFARHLGHMMELAKPIAGSLRYDQLCDLILVKVVPRLLLPLQMHGRVLKPSLLHGDCWDGNTATLADAGDAFIFDPASFFGHNEYDTGNWRTPRHRLSDKAYISYYHKEMPPSEPVEDWAARNVLYSLAFNTSNLINIPESVQKEILLEDMTTLCNMFCPHEVQIIT